MDNVYTLYIPSHKQKNERHMNIEVSNKEMILINTLLDLFIKECEDDLKNVRSYDIREFIANNKGMAEGLKNKLPKLY